MRKILTTFAAGAFLVAGGTAKALTIDDFATGKLDFPGLNVTGAGDTDSGSQNGAGILGGTRDMDLEMLTGAGTTVVTIPSANDILNINNADDATTSLLVTWDDMASTDLTDTGQANGFFLGIPVPIDNRLNVTFTVMGGGNTGSITQMFPDGASGNDFFVPFAGFSGSIDFEAVTSIVMALTSPDDGFDGSIEFVETRPTPPVVPVPGTLALLGAGLVGFAARRRMKRA